MFLNYLIGKIEIFAHLLHNKQFVWLNQIIWNLIAALEAIELWGNLLHKWAWLKIVIINN